MIETLGIRWIELLAQTISFSFVLFVLWKLAYKPVFNMLEARKAKIAEGIANAEKIKAELAKPRPRARKSWPRPANWRTRSSPRRAQPPPA